MNRNLLHWAWIFLLGVSPLWAQSNNAAPIAHIELGAKYVGWGSSYSSATPFDGSEILVPLTMSVAPWKGGKFYAQTQFTQGNYTDSQSGTETFNLAGLTDTVLGFETSFKSFSLPSLFNIGVNVPTGDPAWETKQTYAVVPTEFVDSDYRGRGLGLSCLYGISLPAGSEQYGVAAGYMYSGAFNPSYALGAPAEQLKLGDSVFLSLNRVADRGQGQMDVIRLSAFYFLTTQMNNSDLLQMGPNLNVSYAWVNPKAFSFEVGGQYFLPSQQNQGGQLSTEPFNSLGPRLYLNPSYNFGDFMVAARAKYVLPNGYPKNDPQYAALYAGGGWLAGVEPSYRFILDKTSALKVSASFDYIDAYDLGSFSGALEDVSYGRWTIGTSYEVNL